MDFEAAEAEVAVVEDLEVVDEASVEEASGEEAEVEVDGDLEVSWFYMLKIFQWYLL